MLENFLGTWGISEEQSSFHVCQHSSEEFRGQVSFFCVEPHGHDGNVTWDIAFRVVDSIDGVRVWTGLAFISSEWNLIDRACVRPDMLNIFGSDGELDS